MKKNRIFSGIFAAMFVTTTTLIISSCSQDDDYYDTDMHTLAEKKMTRSGEPSPEPHDPTDIKPGSENCTITISSVAGITFNLTWWEQRWYGAKANVSVNSIESRSPLVSYYDTLGIQRFITLNEYVRCEIDSYATNIGGSFQLGGVRVYYKKAHYNDSIPDGTYEDERCELIYLECPIPDRYKVYNN